MTIMVLSICVMTACSDDAPNQRYRATKIEYREKDDKPRRPARPSATSRIHGKELSDAELKPLLSQFREESDTLSYAAALEFVRMGERSLEALRIALDAQDQLTRRRAVETLGMLAVKENADAIRILAGGLDSSDSVIRMIVVEKAGEMAASGATRKAAGEILRRALLDADPEIQLKAVRTIRNQRFFDAEAADRLKTILNGVRPDVQGEILDTFVEIRTPPARDFILTVAAGGVFHETRLKALECIAQFPRDKEIVKALENLVRDHDPEIGAAAENLLKPRKTGQ